ncbi:DUF5691 domain-containing protein [Siphonobacter sp. SORGH_AS_0500]|uniref:DUF5691 domain-containing protein n=1 Tax=Siphonobacter sp. SORGH_AS_0500 TaxID=1864824 RepID=UPI0028545F02|nr:DUF5691 domain-containing protein [Siphonobacter sp. SORGH_AS_0500]MDR6197027.1 hypothetical protein [Siphonobacter sp. SORGH_AS_0500]
MNTWNELVQVALLGTEKSKFSSESLPQSIQTLLAKADPQDREGFFLTAAALTYQYERSGKKRALMDLPAITPAEQESRLEAPKEAVDLLKRLLDQQPLNATLLSLYLQKLQEKDWVIPSAHLVQVLNVEDAQVQKSLLPVLGKRGEWLRSFHSPWQQAAETDWEKSWQEGKIAERKKALYAFREQNPTLARQRLEESWSELAARERKELLEVLSLNLSKDDEAFLRAIQQELKGNKPLTQETRQLIFRLLALLSAGAEQLFLQQNLPTYIIREKKLLGLVSTPKLVLPEGEDTFFSLQRFAQDWGFYDKNPDSYQYQSLSDYWFWEAVALTNPQIWREALKTDWAGVVKFFTIENAKADRSAARHKALLLASVRFNVPELFVEAYQKGVSFTGVTTFSLQDYQFILQRIPFRQLYLQKNELLQGSWSAELSRHIFQELLELVKSSHVYLDFARQASEYWYEFSDAEIDGLLPENTPSYYRSGEEKLAAQLKEILSLRRWIRAL